MHIAVFCHNHPPHPGGLEVMVQSVTRELARRGHRLTVVTTAWGDARGVSEEEGVTLHRLPAVHRSEVFGVPWPLPLGAGLATALRAAQQANIVHAHGALYATSVMAVRASRAARVPLVLTEHVGFVQYRRELLNEIQRAAWATVGDRLVAAAHRLNALNSRVVDWLSARVPGRQVRFIGNGVDSAAFRPRPEAERRALREALGLPQDELLVLFVGRQSEKKNLEFALDMPRQGFRLVVCGAPRTLPPDVVNLGVLPHGQMPDLYAAVDLMLNPSVGEGFPLALQEAMASGLPVALLWDDGYAQWLDRDVPAACSTLDELRATLLALIGDPERRAVLAARAREWATSRWSWEATAAAYEAMYEDALENRARV
ncbi:MAG TPA: glycosyltransferase family 4 protein [Thermoanaerobaculia bacterium]